LMIAIFGSLALTITFGAETKPPATVEWE